jgi:hypothetical protein
MKLKTIRNDTGMISGKSPLLKQRKFSPCVFTLESTRPVQQLANANMYFQSTKRVSKSHFLYKVAL